MLEKKRDEPDRLVLKQPNPDKRKLSNLLEIRILKEAFDDKGNTVHRDSSMRAVTMKRRKRPKRFAATVVLVLGME